jgi:transcriptional regulator with XRE-family HTH domain
MIKEKIINNIKTIRESKNLTADYIAQQMGISQSTYSRKESGDTDFSLTELIKLGDVLEVSVSKFIDMDLANVINQYNNYPAGEVHQTVTSEDGYKAAISAYEKQVEYLKQQNSDLLAAVIDKKSV